MTHSSYRTVGDRSIACLGSDSPTNGLYKASVTLITDNEVVDFTSKTLVNILDNKQNY